MTCDHLTMYIVQKITLRGLSLCSCSLYFHVRLSVDPVQYSSCHLLFRQWYGDHLTMGYILVWDL
jgi:hypothetical protein